MSDANYFNEIESVFVARSGKKLLTPVEWSLIENWKGSGIPLDIVLKGIESSFASLKAHRKIHSLTYCRGKVEEQFAKWLEKQKVGNAR